MSLSRRSFFSFFGASAATVVAAPEIAKAVTATKPLESGIAIWRKEHPAPWRPYHRERIILRALRMIGALRAGEMASAVMMQAAIVALYQMLDDWQAKGREAPTEREMTYGLANELMPEYAVCRGYGFIRPHYVDRFGNDALTYDPTIKPGSGWANPA